MGYWGPWQTRTIRAFYFGRLNPAWDTFSTPQYDARKITPPAAAADVDYWIAGGSVWANDGALPPTGSTSSTRDMTVQYNDDSPGVNLRRRGVRPLASTGWPDRFEDIHLRADVRECVAAHADAASEFHLVAPGDQASTYPGCPPLSPLNSNGGWPASDPQNVGYRVDYEANDPSNVLLTGSYYLLESLRQIGGASIDCGLHLLRYPDDFPEGATAVQHDTTIRSELLDATVHLAVQGYLPGEDGSPSTVLPVTFAAGQIPGTRWEAPTAFPTWAAADAYATSAVTVQSEVGTAQWAMDLPVDFTINSTGDNNPDAWGGQVYYRPVIPSDPGVNRDWRMATVSEAVTYTYRPPPYRFWLPGDPPVEVEPRLRQIQRDDNRNDQVDSQQRSLRQVAYR